MHPNLIVALVEDRRRFCLCGALPDQPDQLCRNCSATTIARRRLRRHSRSIGGRQANQLARAWTWILATAMFVLRAVSERAGS